MQTLIASLESARKFYHNILLWPSRNPTGTPWIRAKYLKFWIKIKDHEYFKFNWFEKQVRIMKKGELFSV